jgi:hypothetical protein
LSKVLSQSGVDKDQVNTAAGNDPSLAIVLCPLANSGSGRWIYRTFVTGQNLLMFLIEYAMFCSSCFWLIDNCHSIIQLVKCQ